MVDNNSSNDEKVKLFRSLFGGRGDVFARRFDNSKTGKKGYSPCCENQWVRGVCGLLRGVKCAECPTRKMMPVSDEVIRWHLRGKDGRQKPFEMGTYPMAKDETVTFAVIDFDESAWRRDALLGNEQHPRVQSVFSHLSPMNLISNRTSPHIHLVGNQI